MSLQLPPGMSFRFNTPRPHDANFTLLERHASVKPKAYLFSGIFLLLVEGTVGARSRTES